MKIGEYDSTGRIAAFGRRPMEISKYVVFIGSKDLAGLDSSAVLRNFVIWKGGSIGKVER